jgi:hypothetical protein
MEHNEHSVPKIYAAIHQVMGEVRGVDKERVNPHHKFKYTGHDDVTWALHDPFVKAGIVQIVSVVNHHRTEAELVKCEIEIRWVCIHDGSEVKVTAFGDAGMYKGEQQSLQVGKAVSYAVKMAQLKTFMLIGGAPDPEDGEEREREPAAARPRSEPPPPPVRSQVSDDQIRLFEDEYKKVSNQKELNAIRAAITPYMDKLDPDGPQYERLRLADESAALLVSGGA